MEQTRHTPTKCPACGYAIDSATVLRGEGAPDAGDVTICLACSETLVYEEGMTLHKITAEEERAIPADARMDIFRAKLYIATLDKSKLKGARPPGEKT